MANSLSVTEYSSLIDCNLAFKNVSRKVVQNQLLFLQPQPAIDVNCINDGKLAALQSLY